MDIHTKQGVIAEFYRPLGIVLREARRARRMSLADVTRLSGGRISEDSLSAYELARRKMRLDAIFDLAEFYEVPVTTLCPRLGVPRGMVSVDELQAFVDSLRGVA